MCVRSTTYRRERYNSDWGCDDSFSKPLSYVLIGSLDFHISCTSVGELVSVVGIVKVTPHPSEFRWDVIVAIFLRNHLAETKSYCSTAVKAKHPINQTKMNQVTLTTWSLGSRLQSASVSSSPSRYLRLDSPWHPTSSGSRLIRYSSSLARALFRLCSNAETYTQVKRSLKPF